MPHSKKKSFIRSSPLAYVVVPLALAAVTAALLAALSFVLLQPYQMMLGWFFDNTTASQPQDLLAEAGRGSRCPAGDDSLQQHYLPHVG